MVMLVVLMAFAAITLGTALTVTWSGRRNVAVTVFETSMVMLVGLAAPDAPPLQPVNEEPALGEAVSVTMVPPLTSSVQAAPQLTPPGVLLIDPLPVPVRFTVSRTSSSTIAN